MKFISWNIDSLNAALTGESPRAAMSRDVLAMIAREDADIIALQETKLPEKGMNKKQAAALNEYFPDYELAWISSRAPCTGRRCLPSLSWKWGGRRKTARR